MKTKKANPIAVLISDIHFALMTLTPASKALRLALEKAQLLGVPLVIAGDLNDTKAIIRAETMNAIIEILKNAKVPIFVLVGNHDLVNEKGSEHGLNYLRPYAEVIDVPCAAPGVAANSYFLPYQNSVEKFREALKGIPHGSIVIMHQGVKGANMGDYIVDKTSIEPEALKPYRCFSGHYHAHQTIGTVTFIGSSYTTTFGEANDPQKGFLVINSDGTFERVMTELRKHVVIETDIDTLYEAEENGAALFPIPRPEDLVRVKLYGEGVALAKFKKKWLANVLGRENFKLDKIPTEAIKGAIDNSRMSAEQILDRLLDDSNESSQQKQALKSLWREIMNAA